MKKSVISCFAGMLLMGVPAVSMAQGYVGLGIGNTTVDEDGFKDATGFKLRAGSRVNENFAIEFGFTDLGKAKADSGLLSDLSLAFGSTVREYSIDANGLELSGIGIVPVTDKFEAYGKLGVFLWDIDGTLNVDGFGKVSFSDDGNDVFFGLGGVYKVGERAGLGLEFTRYTIDEADLDYLGLNVTFGF